MENNISQRTQIFNTKTIGNIATTISNGLKNHFAKIAVAAIVISALSAITYALKASGFFKDKKVEEKKVCENIQNKTINKQDALEAEKTKICKEKDCDPKYLVGLLQEDYEKIIGHLEIDKNKWLVELAKSMLAEDATISDSGNVFFIGKEAVMSYAKIIVASSYMKDHPSAGWHPTRLLFIESDHPSFNHYKKDVGPPIPLTEGYIINLKYIQKDVAKAAIELYGKDAEIARFDQKNFNKFKKDAPEDCKFKIIQTMSNRLFVAMEKGTNKKVPWVSLLNLKEALKEE